VTWVKNRLDSFCVDVVILSFTQMYSVHDYINPVIPKQIALHPLIFTKYISNNNT